MAKKECIIPMGIMQSKDNLKKNVKTNFVQWHILV